MNIVKFKEEIKMMIEGNEEFLRLRKRHSNILDEFTEEEIKSFDETAKEDSEFNDLSWRLIKSTNEIFENMKS